MPSPSDNKPDKTGTSAHDVEKAKDSSGQAAIAMELPFTLVGAVIVGGTLGYLLDRWLRTGPWLMLVFGGLGFYAGIREVLRRLPGSKNGNQQGG
jgi:ATP synthase protein I